MKFAKLMMAALLPLMVFCLTTYARADDRGTAAEATAMLAKAVAAVATDPAAALAQFVADAKAKGGTFFQKDLYVFCGGADGNFSAHPSLVGRSMRALMDKATPAKAVGEEFYRVAAAGGGEVAYSWPLPGATEPQKKVAIVAKAGEQVCAVGYYP